MKYKNVVFVTSEAIKNMGNVKEYLIANTEEFIAYHYFLGFSDNQSYMEKYVNGKKICIK